jgi:hypothetical protein
MMNEGNEMTREQALMLVATTEMKPFTKADWMSYSGCETENPLIGEFDDFLIVLDGNELEIFPIASEEPTNADESYKFSLQFS